MDKMERMTILVPKELKDDLEILAKGLGITLSSYVRVTLNRDRIENFNLLTDLKETMND